MRYNISGKPEWDFVRQLEVAISEKKPKKGCKLKSPLYHGLLGRLWLIRIKNEKGDPIDFDNHPFLFDIYADQSQEMTIMKAAQVGLSTLAILKNHNDAKQQKIDYRR